MENVNEIKGVGADGREFTANSPEVVVYRTKFPDVTIEAAIGSVVSEYNNGLLSSAETVAEVVAEEPKEVTIEVEDTVTAVEEPQEAPEQPGVTEEAPVQE